ncbi:transposase (plasmid) [Azospirillum sp. B510]|nr:transposase [Azospirillum sp. B510]
MWTEITRAQYRRKGLRYSSDTTDAEWAVLEPFLPAARRLGRPRTVNVREIVNGILFLATSGCQWRQLPKDFPPMATVQRYFYRWRDDGTLCGRPSRRKRRIRVEGWSGASVCPACRRDLWSLGLMKSADQRPNHLSALPGAWSPWVWSIPGLTGSSSRLTTLTPSASAGPWSAAEANLDYAAVGATQVPPHVSTAQAMRAVLLARATAASLAGLRSSSFAAQHRAALSWRASRMTAVAPMTSRRRR